MAQNAANLYQGIKINTASPAELTLMLYEGAIKFCNIAIMAIEKGDMENSNRNNSMRSIPLYCLEESFLRSLTFFFIIFLSLHFSSLISVLSQSLDKVLPQT